MSEALVKNAGDEKQVKNAAEKELVTRDMELSDIITVLNTPAGRRFIWRILGWCGCDATPKRNDDALTYMAIGAGDVGRWLKSEIIEAEEELLLQMMKENMEKTEGGNVRRK